LFVGGVSESVSSAILKNLDTVFLLKPSCNKASSNFGEHTPFQTIFVIFSGNKKAGVLPASSTFAIFDIYILFLEEQFVFNLDTANDTLGGGATSDII
jgi:hypothetical protein